MQKTLTFWCPYIGNIGTVKAVIETAKSLSQIKEYKCKIINAYGEFDEFEKILKKHRIEKINLTYNRFIKKLPKQGFVWSRINYLLIFF